MKKMIMLCVLVSGTFLLASGPAEAQTIWEYGPVSFEKADFADWSQQENQDRITDNVWLTRQNLEGLINFAQEEDYVDFYSPADTEWAFLGLDGNPSDTAAVTASNYSNLSFKDFENALGGFVGNNIGNRPAVLHLVSDDIYLNIEFDHWKKGRDNNDEGGGGFSYTRTSAPVVPEPVSAMLFVTGGAALGIGRFWKNKRGHR